jgi:hypothetical protein
METNKKLKILKEFNKDINNHILSLETKLFLLKDDFSSSDHNMITNS